MCGIVGYARIYGKRKLNIADINSMLDVIAHRGPDQKGIAVWANGRIQNTREWNVEADAIEGVLGFHRLSIRDISERGGQPYINEEKDVGMSFNGEIYNSDELKRNLILLGYRFKGNSDTEVLMNLYLEYGVEKMLELVNGIYSIAIFDARQEKIYLIRDRLGVKPLYFAIQEGVLLFSSEQKSILKYNQFVCHMNEEALMEQFAFRSPYEASLFKEIKSIQPGTYLVVSNGQVMEKQFFDINKYRRYSCHDISFEEASKLFADTLQSVIESQKISDVPIGMQLSGGIDSSLIAFFGSRDRKPLDAHSIYTEGDYYNEQKHIEYIQSTLGLHLYKYDLDEKIAADIFKQTVYHLDGINTHFNALGFFQLSRQASAQCKVLLGGEGADELMGGYIQFVEGKKCSSSEYVHYVVEKDMHVTQETCKKILKLNYNLDTEKRKNLFHSFSGTNFDKYCKYLVKTHLEDLLIKQDKMAMANSIENRVPYLDNRMVQLCMTLPEEYLLYESSGGEYIGKYIAKYVASIIYGKEFAFAKKKGFPIPIRKYLMSNSFRKNVVDRLLPSIVSNPIYHSDYILELLNNVSTISEEEACALWKVLNLEEWRELEGVSA